MAKVHSGTEWQVSSFLLNDTDCILDFWKVKNQNTIYVTDSLPNEQGKCINIIDYIRAIPRKVTPDLEIVFGPPSCPYACRHRTEGHRYLPGVPGR